MLGTARLTGQTTGAVLLATLFELVGDPSRGGSTAGVAVAAGLAAAAAACSSMRLRVPTTAAAHR